jgi:RsiW-degrading membrane proteinase PrsW (M82 family)
MAGVEPIYQLWVLRVCLAIGLGYLAVALLVLVLDPRAPGPALRPPDLGNTIFEPEGMIAFAVLAAVVCWILVVVDRLRRPPPLRTVLAIAALLSASVSGVFLLLLLVHTELTGAGAPKAYGDSLELTYQFIALTSLAAFPVLGVIAFMARACRDPQCGERRRQIGRVVLLVLLLAPLGIPLGFTLARAVPVDVVVCALNTGFAFWAVHGMQRHRRMPFRLLATGFGWGAVVAFGFGVIQGATAILFVPGIVGRLELSGFVTLSAAPAVSEELAKFAGVLVVYLLARRQIDNAVSGIVLGASVGLGFNFAESVLYMTTGGPEFQHWTRQTLGLVTSHATWTALAGAGLAIATRRQSSRDRRLAVVAGLGTAICAHSANNYLGGRMDWWFGLSDNAWVTTLLLTPGMMVMLQAPFAIGCVVLLRQGLREQHAALKAELPAEAGTGSGAVEAGEVDVLLDPSRRFRTHVELLRRHGFAAYRRATKVHAAQLDLAMLRRAAVPPQIVETARNRVLQLKAPVRPVPATMAKVAE